MQLAHNCNFSKFYYVKRINVLWKVAKAKLLGDVPKKLDNVAAEK